MTTNTMILIVAIAIAYVVLGFVLLVDRKVNKETEKSQPIQAEVGRHINAKV
jgi:hypothetical protein